MEKLHFRGKIQNLGFLTLKKPIWSTFRPKMKMIIRDLESKRKVCFLKVCSDMTAALTMEDNLEDDLNGRQPQWRMNSKEDDLIGR